MKKCYIFNLVFLTAFAQSAWAMKKDDNLNQIIENNNISIPENNISIPENNSLFGSVFQTARNITSKGWRRTQKAIGNVDVGLDSEENLTIVVNSIDNLDSVEALDEDSKNGGLLSDNPSYFKMGVDRIYRKLLLARSAIVDDPKSLNVNKIDEASKHIRDLKILTSKIINSLEACIEEKENQVRNFLDKKKDGKDDK